MGLHVLPLTPRNLDRCAPLWGDRQTYSADDFALALAAAARLLEDGRARGAVVIEAGRVRGFGITVFVTTQAIERHLRQPTPQLGKRLLLDAARGDTKDILSRRAIGERNAAGGLELVVVNANYDPGAHDPDAVIGLIIQAYQDTHRGYRLSRMVNEVFGDYAVEVMDTSGCYAIDARFDDIDGTGLRGMLRTLTREQAAIARNPLLAMFIYVPPRVRFTDAEQMLLRAAIDGSPDEALGVRLGLPLTTVKARWARIQLRAFQQVPEIFEHLRDPRSHNRRGVQIRHLILDYVRQHASELTPYYPAGERAPSASTRAHTA